MHTKGYASVILNQSKKFPCSLIINTMTNGGVIFEKIMVANYRCKLGLFAKFLVV